MHVQDKRENCPQKKDQCDTDLLGIRLECPKTCQLYLEDDVYYAKYFSQEAQPPACPADNPDHPTCTEQLTM
jgi:hypothetical protein